jgi:hypothetical protein
MSEYQYYEFQAIDRPLTEADRKALRAISSRAQITATSFTNSYEWGDFRGRPDELMAQWFDLHLYLANWGTRRLMIRWPARLIDAGRMEQMLEAVEWAEIKRAGEHVILDIHQQEEEPQWDQDDGAGWLDRLARLRADVLDGDLRLFYLLWLMEVQYENVSNETPEPMPGIGPLTDALDGLAEFFGIDQDLVAAAAEQSGDRFLEDAARTENVRHFVEELAEAEKTELLLRVIEGDVHVATEIKAKARRRLKVASSETPLRTAGDLLERARVVAAERERREAARAEAERKRRAEEEARARRARLVALRQRGEAVWREVETEIERRNAPGYEKAAGLLFDLKALADEQGTASDFRRRLARIREQHASKRRFIERLLDLA